LKKKRVLIAVGNPHYSEILRKNLMDNSNLFEVAPQEILHRRFIEEMVDIDKPDILIVHDYYLESDLQEPKEKEKEILDVIKKLRVNYDDFLRVIYLCERQKGDPFLSALVGIGVLDIFNENSIDLEDLIEQISEKPRFSKVEKFLHPFDLSNYGLTEEQMAEESEEAEEDVKDEEEKVDQRPIIQNVIEKKIINKVIEKKVINKVVNKNVIKREYQIHIHNQVEKVVGVNVPRKLILVGSPYKRTGSTFFSLMLSKSIQNQGIGVSYIENPYQVPYCYDRFFGHKNAEQYVSLFHGFIDKEEESEYTYEWIHEEVRLIALNADKENPYNEEDVNLEVFIKLLFSLQSTPYVIIDAGSDWEKEIFKELYQLCDYAYIMIEPDISNMERFKQSKEPIMNFIRDIALEDKTFIVGNQFSNKTKRKLLEEDIYLIPSIDKDVIFQSQYAGTFYPDTREELRKIEQAFYPILKEILPDGFNKKSKQHAPFFNGLFKRKIKIEKEDVKREETI
jgi:hypothetical protein